MDLCMWMEQYSLNKELHHSNIVPHHVIAPDVLLVCRQMSNIVSIALCVGAVSISVQVAKQLDWQNPIKGTR